jgi:hypothetical protein
MYEYLVGFLVLMNSALVGFIAFSIYKNFPKISHSNVHRASTKQLMEQAAEMRSIGGIQTVAEDAGEGMQDLIREKPLGVVSEHWNRALELAQLEGCTVDEALEVIQRGNGFDPRGTS